ncbi:MAG: hypothetical protein WCO90_12205, partial [Planctomycetota bacterium]
MVRMGGSGKSSGHPFPDSEPQWRCQRGSATKRWGEKRLPFDDGHCLEGAYDDGGLVRVGYRLGIRKFQGRRWSLPDDGGRPEVDDVTLPELVKAPVLSCQSDCAAGALPELLAKGGWYSLWIPIARSVIRLSAGLGFVAVGGDGSAQRGGWRISGFWSQSDPAREAWPGQRPFGAQVRESAQDYGL